jgi:ribonuclease Z
MKSSFHHRLLNGPFEDTSLYLRFMHEKRALLFDAGDLGGLSNGEIMKISDLFISHTHIDHFIGFDKILRVLLKRSEPLRVFGPSHMIEAIESKIGGYTWNRIREYPIKLDVYAINGSSIRHACFHAENGLRRSEMAETPFNGTLLRDGAFSVKALILDHDVESVAYSVEETVHVNVKKAVLDEMGLVAGPWLRGLKEAVRIGSPPDTLIKTNGRSMPFQELRDAVFVTPGEKVTYVTDVNPTEENISRIKAFARGSTTLYCEACFLERDRDRAVKRNHLTGVLAGRIARDAVVGNLVTMHYSTRYMNSPITPREEAMKAFSGSTD